MVVHKAAFLQKNIKIRQKTGAPKPMDSELESACFRAQF